MTINRNLLTTSLEAIAVWFRKLGTRPVITVSSSINIFQSFRPGQAKSRGFLRLSRRFDALFENHRQCRLIVIEEQAIDFVATVMKCVYSARFERLPEGQTFELPDSRWVNDRLMPTTKSVAAPRGAVMGGV